MKVQFLGQNCFLFTYKDKTILTDPFYNMQKEKSGFSIDAQKIDFVLITHAHEDHTADVKEVLSKNPGATVIGQPEVCGKYKHDNAVDLNFGGTHKIDDLKITMVAALHTSSFPDGSYGGQPAGYLLNFEGKNLYFAGDTGLMAEMELLHRYFGEISAAILPVGGHYTMCAGQASFAAAELIRTKKVIGCHFDTFPPIEIDHQEAVQKFEERGVELVLPELGQELEV